MPLPSIGNETEERSYRIKYYSSLGIPRQVYEPMQVQARHAFLNDIVVLTPTSKTISRGHFAGLAALLRSSTSKALEAAINAVALAFLGSRFRRPEAKQLALAEYILSTRYLALHDISSSTRHSIACIALLSIYEVLNANMDDSFRCMLHLRGIMALMRNEEGNQLQPASGITLLILGTAAYDQVNKNAIDFATNLANNDVEPAITNRSYARSSTDLSLNELVSILRRLSNMFTRAGGSMQVRQFLFEGHLTSIKQEALSLRTELLAWESKQQEVSGATTVGWFTQPYTLQFPDARDLICPAFRADGYEDRKYLLIFRSCLLANELLEIVANMWNTYRQCQLHLCNLICRVNESLATGDKNSRTRRESDRLRREIEEHIDNIYASVPFMLAGDTVQHCKPEGYTWTFPTPAMLLGGLSMQWRLFTIAMLEHASDSSKRHARNILSWFGESLGVGQATVLAQMHDNPRGGITAKGDVLSWTGFLV